jgi:hypothetical protein
MKNEIKVRFRSTVSKRAQTSSEYAQTDDPKKRSPQRRLCQITPPPGSPRTSPPLTETAVNLHARNSCPVCGEEQWQDLQPAFLTLMTSCRRSVMDANRERAEMQGMRAPTAAWLAGWAISETRDLKPGAMLALRPADLMSGHVGGGRARAHDGSHLLSSWDAPASAMGRCCAFPRHLFSSVNAIE